MTTELADDFVRLVKAERKLVLKSRTETEDKITLTVEAPRAIVAEIEFRDYGDIIAIIDDSGTIHGWQIFPSVKDFRSAIKKLLNWDGGE